MKLKITLLLVLLLGFSVPCLAGFPVTRTVQTQLESGMSVTSSDDVTSPAAVKSNKSKGVAIILLLTLGLLAGHRWYLGSLWMYNVFFILTLGGLGIWALADLIGIIVGSYGPKDGRYKKSFF